MQLVNSIYKLKACLKVAPTLLALALLLMPINLESQSLFNILPDLKSYNSQSQGYYIVKDNDQFHIIGDLVDSSIFGNKNIYPYSATFDYDGKLKNSIYILDTSVFNPFEIFPRSIVKKSEGIYFFIMTRNSNKQFSDDFVCEIDIRSGKILKSFYINHPKNLDESFITHCIGYGGQNSLCIASFYWENNKSIIDIIELDTSFVLQKRFQIKNNGRNNYPWYIEKKDLSKIVLIGDSREIDSLSSGRITNKLFYAEIDSVGNLEIFNFLNTKDVFGFFLSNVNTIIKKEENQGWIISPTNIYIDKSKNINANIPYVLSISQRFDTLFWKTRIYDISIANTPLYSAYAITKANNNTGYIVVGDIQKQKLDEESSGLVFKVSNNGDSLWLRKYIPMGFDGGRLLWSSFNEITSTPFNTYLITGIASDTLLKALRTWVLQIDSCGCIVPECQKTVHINEIKSGQEKAFKIYPNIISSNFITVLCQLRINNKEFTTTIYNFKGQEIKKYISYFLEGVQYVMEIPDYLSNGSYFLKIEGGEFSQIEKFEICR